MAGGSQRDAASQMFSRWEREFKSGTDVFPAPHQNDVIEYYTAADDAPTFYVESKNQTVHYRHGVSQANYYWVQSPQSANATSPDLSWVIDLTGHPRASAAGQAVNSPGSSYISRMVSTWREKVAELSQESTDGTSERDLENSVRRRFGDAAVREIPQDDDMSPGRRHRLLLDVQYILERLALSLTDRQSTIWLLSHNDSLGGRPIDALLINGPTQVMGAVERVEQNAFG